MRNARYTPGSARWAIREAKKGMVLAHYDSEEGSTCPATWCFADKCMDFCDHDLTPCVGADEDQIVELWPWGWSYWTAQ